MEETPAREFEIGEKNEGFHITERMIIMRYQKQRKGLLNNSSVRVENE
jgi:hypothetical protein